MCYLKVAWHLFWEKWKILSKIIMKAEKVMKSFIPSTCGCVHLQHMILCTGEAFFFFFQQWSPLYLALTQTSSRSGLQRTKTTHERLPDSLSHPLDSH